jgi:hypothetical protein
MESMVAAVGCVTLAALLLGWRTLGARRAADMVRPARAARNTGEVTGLTKADAEELLDWLEGTGQGSYEVACEESGFTVRPR